MNTAKKVVCGKKENEASDVQRREGTQQKREKENERDAHKVKMPFAMTVMFTTTSLYKKVLFG